MAVASSEQFGDFGDFESSQPGAASSSGVMSGVTPISFGHMSQFEEELKIDLESMMKESLRLAGVLKAEVPTPPPRPQQPGTGAPNSFNWSNADNYKRIFEDADKEIDFFSLPTAVAPKPVDPVPSLPAVVADSDFGEFGSFEDTTTPSSEIPTLTTTNTTNKSEINLSLQFHKAASSVLKENVAYLVPNPNPNSPADISPAPITPPNAAGHMTIPTSLPKISSPVQSRAGAVGLPPPGTKGISLTLTPPAQRKTTMPPAIISPIMSPQASMTPNKVTPVIAPTAPPANTGIFDDLFFLSSTAPAVAPVAPAPSAPPASAVPDKFDISSSFSTTLTPTPTTLTPVVNGDSGDEFEGFSDFATADPSITLPNTVQAPVVPAKNPAIFDDFLINNLIVA
eukprot:gene12847-15087_t